MANVVPGKRVEVGAVRRVEPQRAHRVDEQLLVHPMGRAVAVLVGLDPDQRRLRRALEARDRPGVRVGFLQLVGGAVHRELAHLGERPVLLHVRRQCGTAGTREQVGQIGLDVARAGRRTALLVQPIEEGALQRGAEGEQARVPFQSVVDAGKPAVVQLVRDVQRQGEVVVGQRITRSPHRRDPQRGVRGPQAVDDEFGQHAPRRGQARTDHRTSFPRRLPVLAPMTGF